MILAKYFYLFFLLYPYIALWHKSFEKAGRKSWEALIPGYNYAIASKIGGQPWWWAFLMIVPGIHVWMWMVFNVSYIRKFGGFSLSATLQGIFFPFIIMWKLANDDSMQANYTTNWESEQDVARRNQGDHLVLFLSLPIIGHAIAFIAKVFKSKKKKTVKTVIKEWGDNILFALIAASVIRTYVFEPFQIPTGSMEKTLLVGDFLFVNKLAWGPKVPVTPMSFPLVHNTIPWINVKSYTDFEYCKYTRLPGFTDVNRNDVMVFNYPSGDTAVYDPRMPNGLMGHDYHGIVNNEAIRIGQENGQSLDAIVANFDKWKNKARYEIAVNKRTKSGNEMISHYGAIDRPVDKRENYIKRCVGLPGDELEIVNSQLIVNGENAPIFEFQNLKYIVNGLTSVTDNILFSKYQLEKGRDYYKTSTDGYTMFLTKTEHEKLSKAYPKATFTVDLQDRFSEENLSTQQKLMNLSMYPKNFNISNTTSNFEKFTVPKKGWKIDLTERNVAWYKRCITAYELHTFEEKDGLYYIDGKKATTYTFEMDYYWLMGDNRYNSADSRVWGFVPEDHVVGKASLVWFSKNPNGGVRWDRLFTWIE